MDRDFWMEGYAVGMWGYGWLRVVAGRFLRTWERAELARGWREGLTDRAAWKADMRDMAH